MDILKIDVFQYIEIRKKKIILLTTFKSNLLPTKAFKTFNLIYFLLGKKPYSKINFQNNLLWAN